MIILPAIDIKDGKCVRLYKGSFDTVEQVADDPITTAKSFIHSGATYLHTVDLDGAKDAKLTNKSIFLELAKTSLSVQVGGGIRNYESAKFYLDNGIDRVILGSVALKNKLLVKELVDEYKERIVVGIDAKDGMVATEGWIDTSDVDYITLACEMEKLGVSTIVYTDIGRDGTLEGVNLEQLNNINKACKVNIIASGGVRDIFDIRELVKLNIYGCICGKSIYKGTLDLKEAIIVGQKE